MGICTEIARACIQCLAGTDYCTQKTYGTLISEEIWDTLSIDMISTFPADHKLKFVIALVDIFFKYTIKVKY